jgi:hypothetical protein
MRGASREGGDGEVGETRPLPKEDTVGNIGQQYIRAGLIDETTVSSWMCSLPRCSNILLVPPPKSTGTRWIDKVIETPEATHLRFRVVE